MPLIHIKREARNKTKRFLVCVSVRVSVVLIITEQWLSLMAVCGSEPTFKGLSDVSWLSVSSSNYLKRRKSTSRLFNLAHYRTAVSPSREVKGAGVLTSASGPVNNETEYHFACHCFISCVTALVVCQRYCVPSCQPSPSTSTLFPSCTDAR